MSEGSSNSDLGIGMLVPRTTSLENLRKPRELRSIDGIIQNWRSFLGVQGGWVSLGGFLQKSTRTPKGSGARSPPPGQIA